MIRNNIPPYETIDFYVIERNARTYFCDFVEKIAGARCAIIGSQIWDSSIEVAHNYIHVNIPIDLDDCDDDMQALIHVLIIDSLSKILGIETPSPGNSGSSNEFRWSLEMKNVGSAFPTTDFYVTRR